MKQVRFRLTASYVICLMALGMAWHVFHGSSLTIFPSPLSSSRHIVPCTDASEGGASVAEVVRSDSLLTLNYTLHSGSEKPRAALAIPLISDVRKLYQEYVDFSSLDSVTIIARSSYSPHLTLSLLTSDPQYSHPGEPGTGRPPEIEIPVSPTFSEIHRPLSAFRVPDGWFSRRGIENPDGFRYLDRVFEVQVGSGRGGLLGIPDDMEIKSLRFHGENPIISVAALGILILATAVYVLALRRLHA